MKPETHRMFDSLAEAADHCGVDLIEFRHPAIEVPYKGFIANGYIEVACAGGEYGLKPGWYLLQGAKGMFVVKPDDPDNKWRPAAAPALADTEAPAAPAADVDLPPAPDDSEFADWKVADLRVALAEQNQPTDGNRPELLARLHWLTHPLPSAEAD